MSTKCNVRSTALITAFGIHKSVITRESNLSATFFWSPVGSISGSGSKTFWPHFILQFEKENYIGIESEKGYIFIIEHYCYGIYI